MAANSILPSVKGYDQFGFAIIENNDVLIVVKPIWNDKMSL
jgi:hypothetical protein